MTHAHPHCSTLTARLSVILTGMVAWIATAAPATDNLAKNPGFEVLTADGLTLETWGLPQLPGVRFSWDDSTAHSGKRSGRIDGTDPGKQSRFVQAWRQDIPVPKDSVLWLAGWLRCTDASAARINVLHKSEDGTVLQNQGLGTFHGTFDWRQFAGKLNQVPGTVKIQLVLGLAKSTGTVWFDDLYVGAGEHLRDALGTARMNALAPLTAGSTIPIVIDIALGDEGLPAGGELLLQWANWRPAREFRLGKIGAATSTDDAAMKVVIPPRQKTWPPDPRPIACTLTPAHGQSLPPRTKVKIAATLQLSRFSNVSVDLLACCRASADAPVMPLGEPMPLHPVGGEPAALNCVAESRPVRGAPGRVTVAVTDTHGNPCAAFTGTIEFSPIPGSSLPPRYAFTTEDAGSHTFRVEVPADRVSRIRVTALGKTVVSNPILPRNADEPGIYFGDIHSHCEVSADAVGDPDLAYDYAQRFFGLDFAALSDHSPRGANWERDVQAANRHNRPGQFVTLLGFEWSDSRYGHRNITYRGDSGPDMPTGLENNMKPWWNWLAEKKIDALTIPHHTNTQAAQIKANGQPAWGPADWSEINHQYQRVVEICQNRGSFEVPGGPIEELRVFRKDRGASVQTALAQGHRLGFIGSTDTHSGRPGNGTARCAVVTPEFTRTGIYDAMYARSCYATSGTPIILQFEVNGRPMGTEMTVRTPDTPRQIAWRSVGTAPIKRVDLMQCNRMVRSWTPDGDDARGDFTATAPLAGTEWWYVRVLQQDGNLAWASPVWVDPPGKP